MANKDDLDRLIKLLKMTTVAEDTMALVAIRKANEEVLKLGTDWEAILRGKVTIIEDPFQSVSAPPPSYNKPPPPPAPPRPQTDQPRWAQGWTTPPPPPPQQRTAPPPRPQPRPQPPPQSAKGTYKPKPTSSKIYTETYNSRAEMRKANRGPKPTLSDLEKLI